MNMTNNLSNGRRMEVNILVTSFPTIQKIKNHVKEMEEWRFGKQMCIENSHHSQGKYHIAVVSESIKLLLNSPSLKKITKNF